jgi:hypothetical protein
MKKSVFIAAGIIISMIASSCKSDCNCPGQGGYKKKRASIEQSQPDFQVKLS